MKMGHQMLCSRSAHVQYMYTHYCIARNFHEKCGLGPTTCIGVPAKIFTEKLSQKLGINSFQLYGILSYVCPYMYMYMYMYVMYSMLYTCTMYMYIYMYTYSMYMFSAYSMCVIVSSYSQTTAGKRKRLLSLPLRNVP